MRSILVLALLATTAAFTLPDEQRYKRETEKIGGQAGIRKDPVEPTPFDVKPWKKNEPNLRELRKDQKNGGEVNPANRPKRDIDVAKDKIGGKAGIRPEPTPVDVKPWKKAEPKLQQKVEANKNEGKIGGSAGIRRDKREFDVTKDKIGGKAGIRPKEEEKKFDVAKDKIGGAAGIRRDKREFDVTKDKIGGKAGIRPKEEEKKFDVAKDKIGGAAGIRRDPRGTDGKIGGQAGIRPDNQPTTDVKPWKKNEPRVGGKNN